jgi:PAS domain S-box-containing protein
VLLQLLLPLDGLIRELTVIDASGNVELSTATPTVKDLPSESDRDYFGPQRESTAHGLVFGRAFKQATTGEWRIPISLWRSSAVGGFDGVILATVDPAFFQEFFDAIDTGTNGFITLFNRQGWVLARSPFIKGLFERSWENSPLFKEHLPGTSDKTVRQVIAADGVERNYTYRALRDFPVIVAVGVSLTDSLALWRSCAMAEGIALFLVLCALAAATCALLRQLGQRRLTEQTLKLVEMSIQKASVATLWVGPAGEILRVNPAACELEGYTEEQLLNMTVSDLDPDFPAERWPAHWKELRSLKKMSFETTHVGAEGRSFPVEVDLHWIGFEGKEYNFAFVRDVSTTKKTEALLESERLRMQNIIHGANMGTWEVNLLTQASWFDGRWTAMVGYRTDELLPMNGKQFNSMIHPDDVQLVKSQMLAHVLGNAPHFECEFRMQHKDGHWVWILSHGAVTAWTDKGKPEWISGTHLDISQRKAHEQSLSEALDKAEQATRAKGEFLANMSHEIRTPMNAILGMLKLRHRTDLSSRQLDYASKTERAAKSLLGLLNDILAFSKIDAGKMALDPQPFQLDRVMRDLSVILSANVGNKPLEVLFDIDPAPPKNPVGDWLRLQQVLLNLSSNAIKFTDQGEVVIQIKVIDHTAGSATLRFAVSDSGIGLAQ